MRRHTVVTGILVGLVASCASDPSSGSVAPSTTASPGIPTTEPTTFAFTTTTEARPSPEVSILPLEVRIPVEIVAVRPNNPSFAILDFEEGTTTVYPPGTHRSTRDATDGVAIASSRDLLVYTFGAVSLFDGGLDEEPILFGPDMLREVPGVGPGVVALPTPDGRRLWLVQPGIGYGENNYPTLVELVDVATGERLLQTETGATTWPAGVTHGGLVLGDERLVDTGDGFVTEPGSEQAVLLAENGSLRMIGPGYVMEATGNTVVRSLCDEPDVPCELVLTDPDGSNARTVPRPVEGNWNHLGGPGTPSVSLPLEAVSPNGSFLIMGVGSCLADGAPLHMTLMVVDMQDLTTNILAEFDGPSPLFTWSRDSNWIVMIDQEDVSFINVADPDRVIFVDDVIPADHFALATG